jgi:hypothetical protein
MSILPPYLHQVAIGLLLSDGSLERPSRTGGARLSVILGVGTLPYLLHLFNLFEPYIDKGGVTLSDVYNKKTGKYYSTARLKTVMMPVFVYYHDMFYRLDENTQRYVKRLPEDIDSLMTPVVLAHLIMGDGNLKGEGIIRIYTNSFTKIEAEKLAVTITSKLDIKTKAVHDRNGQYILTINKSQLGKVRTLIESYMHPSMLYKLGICGGTVGFNYKKISDQI